VLFEEPFLLAVPQEHALARKQNIGPADLRASEMVLLEDGHCLRDQSLAICPPNRRGNVRQYHATSLETLRHLVASGMGYTLMPALAVQPEKQMKGLLKYRPLRQPLGRTIIAVCRERYPRMREIEQIAHVLRARAPAF
jgi:LysR family hydrogen peroxide-inducible transcriptional activator